VKAARQDAKQSGRDEETQIFADAIEAHRPSTRSRKTAHFALDLHLEFRKVGRKVRASEAFGYKGGE
jgi:hypothetical protein